MNSKQEVIVGHLLAPSVSAIVTNNQGDRQQQFSDAVIGNNRTNNSLPRSPLVARLDAKKTMAEISIPGMRAIFGHHAHIARRIIWILILITCFSIAVLQVKDRVDYYLQTPVSVNVRVSRNDSLRFPVLSLCNKNTFNMTAMSILQKEKAALIYENENRTVNATAMDVPDLIGIRGWDAEAVWEFISHSMDKMTIECWFGRNLTCKSQGSWTKIATYMGTCYKFELNDPFVKTTGMFNNLYLKMIDFEKVVYPLGDKSGWKMLIHDRLDSPIIDLRTHGTTLYRGWAKDIRIYTREFKTLNTNNRPCKPDDTYSISNCTARCFEEAAAQVLPCKMPYMTTDKLKTCDTPDGYRNASNLVEQLLFYGKWSSNNCTCPRQCNQDLYIPYTETMQMEKPSENLGKLRVFYQDMTFDDIEEELGYAAIPLLCDIGGSLGLLLGASVLTFFEIIEAMSAALLHFTHRIVTLPQRRQSQRH